MKGELIVLTLAIMLIVTATLYDVNLLSYQAPIEYSKWNGISWRDFKGLNPPRQTAFDAFISTEIKAKYISDTLIRVTSYFHPSRSYVFNQKTLSKGLFRHELYHFHITEYIARRFRKTLYDHHHRCTREELDALNERFQYSEDSIQRRYDFETNHSFLLGNQKKWEKSIDSLLNQLDFFSKEIVLLRSRQN